MGNDLWRTPDWLSDWLNREYGPFDIDLAADSLNAKCASFITKEQDSLTKHWPDYGSQGFCNPPYSYLPPWTAKAAHHSMVHGFKSTWVLPVWNGDKHWRYSVFQNAAKEITQIYGRVAFVDADGSEIKGNRGGTVIAHYDGGTQGTSETYSR